MEEYEICRVALGQMYIQVFVYNLLSKKLHFFHTTLMDDFGAISEGDYCLQDILNKKIIHPEYEKVFKELFFKIEQGAKRAEARVQFCAKTGDVWNQILLFRHTDRRHLPAEIIGTIQNISSRTEIERQYKKEEKYRRAMLADYHRIYEINVTKDRFIKLESIQDSTDYSNWAPYMKAMNHLRETKVFKDDWDVFLKIADRESLLRNFSQGQTEFYCEYRVVESPDNIVWSSSATHLLKDPISDDIKGFIYIKDIDKQKKRELELEHQAESDALTGIYNRRTAERLISKLLLEAREKKQYAFFMMDMDNFKSVNDRYGHAIGDFLLMQMSKKVSALLTSNDIFARLGGDEFILFLDIAKGRERVERIANLIINVITDIAIVEDSSYHPSVSIGISLYPECGTVFEELYEASDKALYRAKKNGKNRIEFFET